MRLSETNKGRLQIAGAAFLWGLAGVCVKSITWNSMPQICARSFLSLLFLLAVKRSFRIDLNPRNLLGGLMLGATGMLYVQSIKLTTAGTAIVLQYVAPILVFLYTVIFLHRKVKVSEVAITLAVFGGIVLSFADSLDPTRILGNLLGLASGFTFATQIIVMSSSKNDSNDTIIIGCLISFLISLPFSIGDPSVKFDLPNVFWMLILGIFQYGFANFLFGKGIKKVESMEASLLLTIEPIFNPVPVAIFLGETMGTLAIIGFCLVIFFVTLYAVLPELRKRHPKAKWL